MSRRALVVLIGPMGSGKTRLGKRVAKLLDAPFTDTDQLVVAKHGPITDLFDRHGEALFRALERTAVIEALGRGGVIALGGGAVLDSRTRADLAGERVVLLTTTPEAVASRLRDGRRPLVRNGVAEWQRIYAERLPLYEGLAQETIDTTQQPFDRLAHDLAERLRVPV
ncbi:MAG: shikimate kinase [Micrococcales bacterium]|nr:shikimate kinase [Micrococcales bacterium]